MRKRNISILFYASILSSQFALSACDGEEGSRDTVVDQDVSQEDVRPEICYAHPMTCNTGGGGIDPYDCCSMGTVCCDLCFPPEHCGSRTDCFEECPQVIPCEGIPSQENLACYYNPDDFSGRIYCPVHESPNPSFALACVGECPTGIECPLPEETFPQDTYGQPALCCPENWSCDIVSLYNLPVCAAP